MPGNFNFKPDTEGNEPQINLKKKKKGKNPFGKKQDDDEQDRKFGKSRFGKGGQGDEEEEDEGEEHEAGESSEFEAGEQEEHAEGGMEKKGGSDNVEELEGFIGILTELLIAKKVITEEELYTYAENKLKPMGNKQGQQPQQNPAGPQPVNPQSGGYPGAADTNNTMGGQWGNSNPGK